MISKVRLRSPNSISTRTPNTAKRFGIRGVPTLYVFKGGEVVGQQVGAAPKTVIKGLVDKAL